MNDEKHNSELGDRSRQDVPSYTEELGTRISLAIERIGGVRAAAKYTGTTEDTLANWRDGRARPSFFGMHGLANAAKIRFEWLATGVGPMRAREDGVPTPPATLDAPSTDARLMGRLVERILLVYKEMGFTIAVHQATERAAAEHDRIVAAVSDPDDRLIQIGEVTAALRQELRAAARDPANSKRPA